MYLRTILYTAVASGLAFVGTNAFGHDPDDYGNYPPVRINPPAEGEAVDSPLLFDVSGTVGTGFTWGDHNRSTNANNSDLDDTQWPFVNGDARMSIPITNKISTQLDFGGFSNLTSRGESPTDEGEDQAQNYFYAGVHLDHRNPEVGLIGLFGLVGNASGGEPENAVLWSAGIEAERYFGNLTTYGQFGWLESDDGTQHDSLDEAWLIRGGIRYYLDDFTRFVADYQYGSGGEHNDSVGDTEAQSWVLRFEKRNKYRPITWYIGYQGTQMISRDGTTDRLSAGSVVTGFSIGLGAQNLKESERRGAGGTMPNVGEWTAWTLDSVD